MTWTAVQERTSSRARDGDDTKKGGLGPDQIGGDAGRDTVTYEDRTARITVTLDGVANDGEDGENDNVGPDVEIVLGGSDWNTVDGDADHNALSGGSSEDLIAGLAGDDRLLGGSGSDLLRARDHAVDDVSCGDDDDLALVDPEDTVRDCEWVDPGGQSEARRRSVGAGFGPSSSSGSDFRTRTGRTRLTRACESRSIRASIRRAEYTCPQRGTGPVLVRRRLLRAIRCSSGRRRTIVRGPC